jgi:hypothetical protein
MKSAIDDTLPITSLGKVSHSPRWPNQHARKTACVHGHPFTPDNLLPSKDGQRRCRACRQQYKAKPRAAPTFNPRGRYVTHRALRKSEPGRLLARGPLDYDVPVTVRCGACGGVYISTLGEMSGCPHCHRVAA